MFRLFRRYQLTLETKVTPSGRLTPVTSRQIALQLSVTHRNTLASARSGHLHTGHTFDESFESLFQKL